MFPEKDRLGTHPTTRRLLQIALEDVVVGREQPPRPLGRREALELVLDAGGGPALEVAQDDVLGRVRVRAD